MEALKIGVIVASPKKQKKVGVVRNSQFALKLSYFIFII